jgi:hypothetical protein
MSAVLPSKTQVTSSERKKIYALVGLLIILVVSVIYSFSGSSAPPPPPGSPQPARSGQRDRAGNAPVAEVEVGPSEPLPLDVLAIAPVGDAVARNPFAYPPAPPPPPPPRPPDPPVPTILIGNVTPATIVAGVPRPLDVTVTGKDFPVDAKVKWNGRMLRTQRQSPEVLRVSLTPAEFSSPGAVRIQVVSESQPSKLWSAERTFDVREAPRPTFQYIGRVGDLAVVDYGGQGNQKPVRVGDLIGQPAIWKVVAITPEKIELLDTRNDIPRSIALARKDR